MIRDYANAAANERTFLAWIRTGIAIIALGFVIERFNLFLLALASGAGGEAVLPKLHMLASPAGQYGGAGLVGVGVLLIVVATLRFLHTARLLADDSTHGARATRATLLTLSLLILGVAGFSAYLAFS